MRRHRGLTLLEVIIVMAVFAVVTGTFFWTLIASKRIFQSSVTRVSGTQDVMTVMLKLQQELSAASFSTVQVSTNALSFASAFARHPSTGVLTFQTDGSGLPVYQNTVVVYIPPNSTRLLRKETAGTTQMTQAQLDTFRDSPANNSRTEKRLTDTALSFTAAAGLNDARTVTLNLQLRNTNAGTNTVNTNSALTRGNGRIDAQQSVLTVFVQND